MAKGIMTVLLHTVEYDTGSVIIDAEAEETLHDIVYDKIDCDKKTEGVDTLELEDADGYILSVNVAWKIVNPEAKKWKELAESMYTQLKLWTTTIVVETHPTKLVVKEYEELIKQQENE